MRGSGLLTAACKAHPVWFQCFYLSCKLSRLHLIICPCFSTLNMRVLKNRIFLKFFPESFFKAAFRGLFRRLCHGRSRFCRRFYGIRPSMIPISHGSAAEIQFSDLKGLTGKRGNSIMNTINFILYYSKPSMRG